MKLDDLRKIEVDKQYLTNIIKNNNYNEKIIRFYDKLRTDGIYKYQNEKFLRKIESIKQCNSIFEIDHYKKQKIKDFKRTNLCKDKFCSNCKKVKQASRMARFIPEIQKFRLYEIYHLVLTTPNVSSKELEQEIKKQLKMFPRLIEYLKCKKRVKGIDFAKHGYLGAIRSLEVTFKNDSYHPHLHVLLIFKHLKQSKMKYENIYSFDYYGKKEKRLFTDFEILIQKIWKLLHIGEKVTKKNIEELDVGYSCILDEFRESHFYELFKYMTKNKSESVMTYDNFKTLYESLYRVRQIQGYGCLYNLKDEDLELEVNELYDEIIENLKKIEDGEVKYESPHDLLYDNQNLLISRKKIHNYLREIIND